MDDGEESGESWVSKNLLRKFLTGVRGLIFWFWFLDRNQSSLSNKEYSIMTAISKEFQLYDLHFLKILIYLLTALWPLHSGLWNLM